MKRCRARSTASPKTCWRTRHTLLKDIKSLDILYAKTLTFYDELALYIAAGEAKLNELDATAIPAKEAEVECRRRRHDKLIKAQELRDLRARARRSGTPGP